MLIIDAPAAMPAASHPAVPLEIDADLIRAYGGNGPRYTSYPTAGRFREAFGAADYRHWLANRNVGGIVRPLGLYVHVPFCDTLCFYCACNKIGTKNHQRAVRYVDYLEREIAMAAGVLGRDRHIVKMHWGGGTPTFLGEELTDRLMHTLRTAFDFDRAGEYAIEVDPRKVDAQRVAHLGRAGFNRMSIGVQDFDERVQRAVNRVQSLEQTREVIDAARANGFRSINLDLIYGLPLQTLEGFGRTLERVIECDPDRVALYSYAHLPSMFKPQERIREADLPRADVKLALMTTAIRRLCDAGYVYIGMDHFAKPTDELAIAQRKGNLTRDFQGYSTGGDCDLVAFGTSAIGKLGPTYVQNAKTLDAYYEQVDAGEFPIVRGLQLTADDLVRRAVIQALACRFAVCKESIAIGHLVEFDTYFAAELEDLRRLEDDGLVEIEDDWIQVTPRGRLLVRAVCAVFDKHLRMSRERGRYSRVV